MIFIAAVLALALPAGAFADEPPVEPPAEEPAAPAVTCAQGGLRFSVSGPDGPDGKPTPGGSYTVVIRQGRKQVTTVSGTDTDPVDPIWLKTGVFFTIIIEAADFGVSKTMRQIYVVPGVVRVFTFYPAGDFPDERKPVVSADEPETVRQCSEGGWLFRAGECKTLKGGHQTLVPVKVEITIFKAGKIVRRLIASGRRWTTPVILKPGFYRIKFYVPKYKLTKTGKVYLPPGKFGPFTFTVTCT